MARGERRVDAGRRGGSEAYTTRVMRALLTACSPHAADVIVCVPRARQRGAVKRHERGKR